MRNNLIINFIQSDIIVTIDRSGDVVVGSIESIEDVADHLVFRDRLPGCSELRREPLHFGEERRGGQLQLLGVAERTPQQVDLGTGARAANLSNGGPDGGGRINADGVSKDFR
jgi:hypothetical protein